MASVAKRRQRGTSVACLVVTGDFLTTHARMLWAEGAGDRAIDLLVKGLHGMTPDLAVRIVTGSARLVGDSSIGIDLEDDSATEDARGLPLPSVQEAIGSQRQRADLAEQDSRDRDEVYGVEGRLVGSPRGAVVVPRRMYGKILTGEATLDDVRVYRVLRDEYEQQGRSAAEPIEPHLDPPVYLVPKPKREITSATGWLAPDGNFYACASTEHQETADRLLGDESGHNPEAQLERHGWVKLYVDPCGESYIFEGDRHATEAQRKRILDYCLTNGKQLPFWMEKDDGSND